MTAASALECQMFTPPQLAKRYGVTADKVVRWILAGELAALNLATTTIGRPRFKISPEAVEAFERRRAVLSPPAGRSPCRRRKTQAGVKEFF